MSNNLAVDYSQLNDISYDDTVMAQEYAACIELPEGALNNNSNYTKQQKIEAVAVYIVIGTIRATSRVIGIPYRTLFGWVNSDWWADCINQTQHINKQLVNSRTTKIINKAFDNVEERLDNGEYATYDSKAGEVIMKPVSAKDSATIFGIMYDKQRINNSLATSITQSTTTHLIDIKGQFDAMSQAKVIEGSTE